jgi:chromosome segregation protein
MARRAGDAEVRLQEPRSAEELAGERSELSDEPAPRGLAIEIARLEKDNQASDARIAWPPPPRHGPRARATAAGKSPEAGEAFAAARKPAPGPSPPLRHRKRGAESLPPMRRPIRRPPPLLPEWLGSDAAPQGCRTKFEPTGGLPIASGSGRSTPSPSRNWPSSRTAVSKSNERDELQEAINRLRGSIGSLNREGRVRLLEAYEQVDKHFRSLFTTLFDGGQAHLALVESDDPLEAGLEIMAQPPGKRLAALTLLSGGEQALTAVALIFALFLTNPAPICVLDEVDAPLDDANVERFCDPPIG